MDSVIRGLDQLGREDLSVAGGKGANLGELVRAGFPVPRGFVITTAAYESFVEATGIAVGPAAAAGSEPVAEVAGRFDQEPMPPELEAQIVAAYTALGEDVAVAVRSSATAEDLAEASFAGQQDTLLNITGSAAVLHAVRRCWASLWTSRAVAYRAQHGVDSATVSLAVVVQELVDADAAGVMFTANPSNGRRDEVVLAAAWGLGESIVSGSVDTDEVVLSARDGAVVSRRTAEKTVMTVRTRAGTEERAVPADRRRAPVLSDAEAVDLMRLGVEIAEHFGCPQDIEWARAGGELVVVQSRPVTALPEPSGPVPNEWPVPDPRSFYFRASIVEQLPDPLSPWFADLTEEAVPASLRGVLGSLAGHDVLDAEDLGFPTINGYAYYRYSRRGLLRFSLQSPRLFQLLGRTGLVSLGWWRGVAHPQYVDVVASWADRRVHDLPADELLTGVRELVHAGAAYYTAVQTVIPVAAMSEIVFGACYDRLVRRAGDPPAQAFLLGFDSTPIRAEKSLHDLADWAGRQPELSALLRSTPSAALTDMIGSVDAPAGVHTDVWVEWRTRFADHLGRFGHTVYNLDFVNPVPADDPIPLLDTLRFYLRGQGSDPYARQRQSAERRENATTWALARLDPVRGALLHRLLGWAQQAGPAREDALADVGLAWPALRRLALEAGRRLVAAGALTDPADVFWLREAEIRRLLRGDGVGSGSWVELAEDRKMTWRGRRRATPPQLLPRGTWMDRLDALMPAATAEESGDALRGVGASGGRVTATARVLTGPHEFSQMRPGDILVASITTPAWTPLFAIAAGVVTDIGGPLSHSSIVAREYAIPAVLGTGVATRRIRSGQQVTVDGDAGRVWLLGEESAQPPAARAEPELEVAERSRRRRVLALAAVALGVLAARHRRARGARRR